MDDKVYDAITKIIIILILIAIIEILTMTGIKIYKYYKAPNYDINQDGKVDIVDVAKLYSYVTKEK